MERVVMVKAFASPPPLFSGGSPDLKGNARRFLERALVISALVHLAAAGVFRATYERMIPKEEETIPAPTWHDPTIIDSRIIPIDGSRPAATKALDGIFQPEPEDVPLTATNQMGQIPMDGVGWDPSSRTVDPSPGPPNPGPPSERVPGFTVAEILPVPVSTPLPDYPDFAREVGAEGKVVVRVLVGLDGYPKRVIAVSGPKMLFDAAVEGVKKWKFKPGMTSGQAVEVWVEIPVVFRLGS
jgi:TonB family protein